MDKPKEGLFRDNAKRTICLMSKDMRRRIFVLPDTSNVSEKAEILERQIYQHLIAYYEETNGHDDVVIKVVTNHLRALISYFPEDKEWICQSAEKAGRRFYENLSSTYGVLRQLTLNTNIQKGGMPFKVKSIKQERPRINAGPIGKMIKPIRNFFGGSNMGITES